MEIEIEKLISQYEHKLDRSKKRESDLESRKENLSCHGYWDLGYFGGLTYAYENIIDELKQRKDLFSGRKSLPGTLSNE